MILLINQSFLNSGFLRHFIILWIVGLHKDHAPWTGLVELSTWVCVQAERVLAGDAAVVGTALLSVWAVGVTVTAD